MENFLKHICIHPMLFSSDNNIILTSKLVFTKVQPYEY